MISSQINSVEERLLNKMDSLPDLVTSVILERIRVDGANPITRNDIRDIIREMLSEPLAQLLSITTRTVSPPIVEVASQPVVVNETEEEQWYKWRDGSMHMVPEGFKWPSYCTSTMFNLWFFGDNLNSGQRIRPFKFISTRSDLTQKLCRTNRCRTKKVVISLINIAREGQIIRDESDINRLNYQSVFDYAFPRLIRELYTNDLYRPNDVNINTLGNRM